MALLSSYTNFMSYQNLELEPKDVDVVIYHKNCPDGLGGAFAAWYYFTRLGIDKHVEYIGASHGEQPPDVTGKNLLIVDFSYKKDVLNALLKIVNKMVILDHHLTAMEDLKDLDPKHKIFDMNHSGAYLSWVYFFPEEPVPKLILYIEDRDIWTKKMELTDEFSSWFSTITQNFENFVPLLNDSYLMSIIKTEGVGMEKANKNNISKTVKYADPIFMRISGEYYMVVHINTTVHKSDIGNQVLVGKDMYPNADFSASYSIDDRSGSTLFSLRSTNKHIDCSKIAELFGGGGHRNASGAKIQCITATLPGEILSKGQLYDKFDKIYFGTIDIVGTMFNVVYFNMSSLKSKIGKYLLRDKYIITEGGVEYPVQVCRSIEMNRSKENYLPSRVHIAAIWSYDGYTDTTTFSIVFDSNIKENEREKLKDKYNGDFYGAILVTSHKGLLKDLL